MGLSMPGFTHRGKLARPTFVQQVVMGLAHLLGQARSKCCSVNDQSLWSTMSIPLRIKIHLKAVMCATQRIPKQIAS